MKILYAYLYCNLGGVSSVIRERISADAAGEIEVSCCFSQDGGGGAQMRDMGATVHLHKDYIRRTCQLLAEEHFDAVYIVDEARHVPVVREHYSGPLVLEVHTSTPAYLDQITDEIVAKLDHVLVPSKWSRQQVVARLQTEALTDRILILPDIAMSREMVASQEDTTAALTLDGAPYLLWVGKLSGGKNWLDALRIFAELRRQVPIRFVMVTGGSVNRDNHAQFVSELIALGLDGVVDWRHSVERQTISGIYSAVARSGGALLCTSLAESFGLVVVESLAHGVPVFSSNTHALPELIRSGRNGHLFPVGGTSDASQALLRYLNGEIIFDRAEIESSVPPECRPKAHFERFRELLHACIAQRDAALGFLERLDDGYEDRKLPTAKPSGRADG